MALHLTLKALKLLTRLGKICVYGSVCLFLASHIEQSGIPSTLEKVQQSGTITMVSRNGPTTYYEGPEGMTGFEYVLAKAFADHLGVELVIRDEENLGLLLNSLNSTDTDFAAAGLSVTEQREFKVNFAPSYLSVTQKLVYRSGQSKPRKIEDLYGKNLVVIGNSSHEENLRNLKRSYPELKWSVRYDLEMVELMEMVHLGEIDHTIIDSNAYEVNSTIFPRARVAFDISEPEKIAWAFPKDNDASLLREAERFFQDVNTSRLIEDAREKFYGHVGILDYGDSILFARRLETRLPKWREQLMAAAEETNLDWQLLAALSYQESHWNPRAVSHTGVRGFMMLTRTTAKEVNVENRLDPEQSIQGGARYFRRIYDRIPDRIGDPDRTWLALAAYNIGFGHLEDARILTEHHGGNPDKWSDVRENMLLLTKRKYYKYTKHGYARGWEAVEYVKNIRNFYSIIAWHEKASQQQLAMNNDDEADYADFSSSVTEAVRTLSTPSAEL